VGLIRGVARGVTALVTLAVGVALVVVLAGIGLPLIVLAVAGVVGAAVLMAGGLPLIVAAIAIAIAIAALALLVGGFIKIGVFALKVMLFALLLSWLARVIFGRGRPRRQRMDLVGMRVADIPAPSIPLRDKYDVAAQKELDEEMGF
jgi:hypothetical protein